MDHDVVASFSASRRPPLQPSVTIFKNKNQTPNPTRTPNLARPPAAVGHRRCCSPEVILPRLLFCRRISDPHRTRPSNERQSVRPRTPAHPPLAGLHPRHCPCRWNTGIDGSLLFGSRLLFPPSSAPLLRHSQPRVLLPCLGIPLDARGSCRSGSGLRANVGRD